MAEASHTIIVKYLRAATTTAGVAQHTMTEEGGWVSDSQALLALQCGVVLGD